MVNEKSNCVNHAIAVMYKALFVTNENGRGSEMTFDGASDMASRQSRHLFAYHTLIR